MKAQFINLVLFLFVVPQYLFWWLQRYIHP